MAKNFVYIGIAVLALIAVILGYKIYQQRTLNPSSATNQQAKNGITNPGGANQSTATPSEGGIQNNTPAQSTDLDLILKQFPQDNSTKEEKMKFYNTLARLGKTSDTLDISMCNATPLVLNTNINAQLKVVNNDTIARIITRGTLKYTIPPQQSLTMKVSDWGNPGIMLYHCNTNDGSSTAVGILNIAN